jgi:hypothetical protein
MRCRRANASNWWGFSKIVDHDVDLRFQAFPQVRGGLTATGGLPLVFLASTTQTPDHPQSDTRSAQLAGRRTRAPASSSRCQDQLADGASTLWLIRSGAATREWLGCPVDNDGEATAGRRAVGPKGTRAVFVPRPRCDAVVTRASTRD